MPGSLLAQRRTERRPRGPRDRRARSPLDRAGDMIGRAGHELGVAPVEMHDDHGPVVGEHVAGRADLVDLAATVDLPREVHPLTRRKPLAVLSHMDRDVGPPASVSASYEFLTRSPGLEPPSRLPGTRVGNDHGPVTEVLVFSTVVALVGVVVWIVLLLWAAREDGRDQERRDRALAGADDGASEGGGAPPPPRSRPRRAGRGVRRRRAG